MRWTDETPTKAGLYYFRDKHARKKPGHAAWIARVGPVRDESRGLYADCFYTLSPWELPESIHADSVAPLGDEAGIILTSHPILSHSPVSKWQGEWWGPLLDMEYTTGHYAPMLPGLYQLRDEYAAKEAGMAVWMAVVCNVQDQRFGRSYEAEDVILDLSADVSPFGTIEIRSVTKLCAVYIMHPVHAFQPVDEIKGIWRGPFPMFDPPNAMGVHITNDYVYPLDQPEDQQPKRIVADTSAGDIAILGVPLGRTIDIRNVGTGMVRVLPSQGYSPEIPPMGGLTVQSTQWSAGESHDA